MTALLPREWRFDDATSEFVTHGAAIRVVALPSGEAADIKGAQEQVEDLYRDMFEAANHPVARAKKAVETAFTEQENPTPTRPSRTVLAYYDAKEDTESDRIAAFTRVSYDGDQVMISSIAITFELTELEQEEVSRAVVAVTNELAQVMAKNALQAAAEEKGEDAARPIMVWQGMLGASDFLKQQFTENGFSTELTDRLEMTAFLKDHEDSQFTSIWKSLGIATGFTPQNKADGVEIRALDLANDDLLKVYNVLKLAFGGNPPAFESWKRHYASQPRFAPDLSFVAWKGEEPVSVSLIELMVEGEGGGEAELEPLYTADAKLSQEIKDKSLTEMLIFPVDYEERKSKIRAIAKTGYVCGVATLPEFRGKGLARDLLRQNFQAGARAGLDSIYLGTDRQNPAAVQAYSRAGMVITKAENPGRISAKFVPIRP